MIWDWELGVLTFALGLGIGFLLTWQMAPRNDRIRELEKELDAVRTELMTYRDKVNQHFQTSATLFEDMTERYRAVYQHLASSAQELCIERPDGLHMNFDAVARLPVAPRNDAADTADVETPPATALEGDHPADDDDSYLGDAPNIPELTEEVDVPIGANADKKTSTAA